MALEVKAKQQFSFEKNPFKWVLLQQQMRLRIYIVK